MQVQNHAANLCERRQFCRIDIGRGFQFTDPVERGNVRVICTIMVQLSSVKLFQRVPFARLLAERDILQKAAAFFAREAT